MATENTSPRSRRAILAAALGAGAAFVASAVGRPLPVSAGVDGDVVLGADNASGTSTGLSNHSTTNPPLAITSTYGTAMTAEAGTGTAILAHGAGSGVQGSSNALSAPGVIGWSTGNGTGLLGYTDGSYFSGPGTLPGAPAQTGVYGYAAQGATAVGVKGESTTGTGGYFTATTGTALKITGKAAFSRSGRGNVAAGKAYADIVVPGGLTSHSVVHATLQTYRVGVAIAAVRTNYPSAGKARIYLTKIASRTAVTYVGWFVAEY